MATRIEWTTVTWNPISGCSKVSEACQNCYAKVMARRLQKMPASKEKYKNGFKVTLHPECLQEPCKWKKPTMCFVVSMGDLFHEDVPFMYIDSVMDVIRDNPQHTFQILTKRAWRMADYFRQIPNIPPKNAWLGVTCESNSHYDRIEHLRDIYGASVKFLSCEPLLSEMGGIDLTGIDWVIMGGETGPKARPTNPDWFRSLREAVRKDGHTALFFKKWGVYGPDGIKRTPKENGNLLDGVQYNEYPKCYDRT